MAITVTHTTTATQPDSGDGRISSNAWNASHALTGLVKALIDDLSTHGVIGA